MVSDTAMMRDLCAFNRSILTPVLSNHRKRRGVSCEAKRRLRLHLSKAFIPSLIAGIRKQLGSEGQAGHSPRLGDFAAAKRSKCHKTKLNSSKVNLHQ